MTVIAPVQYPVAAAPVEEGGAGLLARYWFLLLNSFAAALNKLLGDQRLVDDRTLTAASTTINPPAATDGGELVVILRQDATGGRAVVWGTGFAAASVAIDTTASTISTFRFVYSGSAWVMVGQPTTGMTA